MSPADYPARPFISETHLGAASPTVGSMSTAVLQANDITVRFGGVMALQGVSLSFEQGRIHGLIGPNGAGKTTFFDILSGMYRPTTGRVLLAGVDITDRSATWRARQGIRRTFQRQQTFGWLTVEDNLRVALDWRRRPGLVCRRFRKSPIADGRDDSQDRVSDVIALCHLEGVRTEYAGNLPIGQARLVELARALVDRPAVLLLDEPTSGLEEREVERVGALIRTVRDDGQTAIVLVEHDIGFVMRECDRISVLNLGRLLADGSPDVVRADEEVLAAYLG